MVNISPHITYAEATYSDTAKRLKLDNTPSAEQLLAMQEVATRIFEPLRAHFGLPIHISSFFRSNALNEAVGGSTSSQHKLGEAMDVDCDKYGGLTNKQIFDWVKDNVEYDQLIWEYGTKDEPAWVHFSYTTKRPNRKQIVTVT